MLESFIDRITRASLRFKWVTIGLSILALVAGVFALTQLKQELIPSIEFPQSVVIAVNPGMDPESLRDEVTIPIEDAVREVEGVVNVESTTSSGLAFIVVRNEFGLDQDAIRADLTNVIEGLTYPQGMEIPELLTFSLSDLPIAILSVSSPDLSLIELKALAEAEIIPALEAIEDVADVSVSGGQELPTPPPPTPEPTEEPEPTPLPTAVPTEVPTEVPETEGVELPESWIQAAASQNITITTVDDLTPELVGGIASFAPQLLEDLTPEMLLAMPIDALAALPEDYLGSLDPELGAQLAERLALAPALVEAGELPAAWQSAGQQQGVSLVYPEDVTPEVIQAIASFAPFMLEELTPDNLRGFSPEVLAWLPQQYIETLEPDLQVELNELAQPAGGLGALAAQAEAETAELATGAPELSGLWREAPEEGAVTGMMPSFETAADLIDSGFAPSAAELLNLLVESGQPQTPQLMADLTPEVIAWLIENEVGFLENLNPASLRLLAPEVLVELPEDFLSTLDPELRTELEGIASGTVEAFIPTETINRVNGNPSLALSIYKDNVANTVSVSHEVFDKLEELEADTTGLRFDMVFEQASFIEESISGVAREGTLGAIFAVIVILIFLSGLVNGKYRLSWQSTLVTAVSIPLSVFMAFALFKYLPPVANVVLEPLAGATSSIPILGTIVSVTHRMFPVGITLNIMTLSGMTVAVGRVVDDSIVVLENIYRHIQRGEDMKQSVLVGTRDVAIAIFASTVTTVVVFLPIGLLGGLVGQFFLPFGVAVTYALGSSFLVAVTIVPLLAFLFIRKEHLPEEGESILQRGYTPILRWALKYRAVTLAIAGVFLVGSMYLLSQRPRAFLPDFGEVQITASVKLPNGTTMAETDNTVVEFETALTEIEGVGTIQSEIGSSGGLVSRFLGGAIDQAGATTMIKVENADEVDPLTAEVRQLAEAIFGAENVTVSSGSLTSSAFGSFALVLSGDPAVLVDFNDEAIAALDEVDGLTNVSSNLADVDMILRVDGEPAVRYTGELETEDSLGVTEAAKAKLESIVPAGITVSEGFETQAQTQGFQEAMRAVLISILAVYLVMVITFRSFVHPFTILFSLPLAIIGAAVALWITDRVVGISALIGLMMLVGIVVTNAIVLIDRVQANRKKRGLNAYDALVEGGRTRLRPILMTAIAAILALVPLALGLTEGAIIAADLATVVIGGLFTSTLLTLLVVPVMYSLLDRLTRGGKV
ncbi:MAG TPA: efflux RND transporter permease subunit [Anaerolineae bacterium]|nr:efflux RND transporter permease subunit [Anaerolineae bacterium]